MLRNPCSTQEPPCPIGSRFLCKLSYHSDGATVPRHVTTMSLRPIRAVSMSSLTATNPIQLESLLHVLGTWDRSSQLGISSFHSTLRRSRSQTHRTLPEQTHRT